MDQMFTSKYTVHTLYWLVNSLLATAPGYLVPHQRDSLILKAQQIVVGTWHCRKWETTQGG